MAKTITLFGFKKVIDTMKIQLENEPFSLGHATASTNFVTSYLKVTFSVVKSEVARLNSDEMETYWSMEVSWAPTSILAPSVWVQHSFSQALATYLGCIYSKMTMSLETENIPHMYSKLKAALEAEMCAGCGLNIVPGGLVECYECMMYLSEEDDSKNVCGVCKDVCCARIETTPCCKQYIHRVCSRKWDGDCPFCRAPRM
jgi:hypothetical protein